MQIKDTRDEIGWQGEGTPYMLYEMNYFKLYPCAFAYFFSLTCTFFVDIYIHSLFFSGDIAFTCIWDNKFMFVTNCFDPFCSVHLSDSVCATITK
jgi:hypothetical protein